MSREIATPFGPLRGVEAAVFWPDGVTPRSLAVVEENVLATPLGPLTPLWLPDEKRHQRVEPVQFHRNGMFRALPLQHPTTVRTPAGPVPAELLTFHPGGELARVFPLNGKLSGFWTWRDERALARPLAVPTPQGERELFVISLHFFPSGRLSGLTLWPEETMPLDTPLGPATARIGASFHESGALASFEPATPWEAATPIGLIQAFDPDPEGISGDLGSVRFAPDGRLTRLRTASTVITARRPDGTLRSFAPGLAADLCGDGEARAAPLDVAFEPDRALLGAGAEAFSLADCVFSLERGMRPLIPIAFPCAEG